MATWFSATDVSVTANSNLVLVNQGEDPTQMFTRGGEFLWIIGYERPLEVKAAHIAANGDRIIELENPWPYVTDTGRGALGFPTAGDLNALMPKIRQLVERTDGLVDNVVRAISDVLTSTDATLSIDTVNGAQQVVPYGYLKQVIENEWEAKKLEVDITQRRLDAMQKLVDNAVVRLKFDTDEGHQHNDLSVTRSNATSLINYTCSTTATGQTAEGRIVEVAPDTPRIVWNEGKAVGLLNEPSSENLNIWSDDFVQSGFSTFGATIETNSGIDPEGGVTADKMIVNSGKINEYITKNYLPELSDIKTVSIYFKPYDGRNSIGVMTRLGSSNAYRGVVFDADTETILGLGRFGSTGVDDLSAYGFDKLENGWYRIWFTESMTNDYYNRVFISDQSEATGDGTSGFLIWRLQIENNELTSPIKTNDSPAVRGYTLTEILTSIKNSKNTYYTEFILGAFNSAETAYVMNESSGGFDNRMTIRRVTEDNFRFIGVANGVGLNLNNFVSIPAGSLVKLAVVFDGSQVKVFINGSLINTTAFDVPSGLDRLQIGQEQGGNVMNTTFADSILSSMTLTDAEAIALTTLEPEA